MAAAVSALAAGPLAAQSGGYSLALRDAPVAVALEDLVALTDISLVYASDVVRGRTTVCRLENAAPEALLACITEGAGLDYYRLSSGTYVVIAGPEALPAYGSLTGRILDDVTGSPVPWATVELADGRARTLADATGLFILPRLLPGPQSVRVSRIGYAPVRFPVEIPSDGGARREVRLDPTVLELDPIVVEGMEGVGLGRALDGSWRREDRADAVFLDGDVARQARAGLGVARRPMFADLSIQGSAPGEHVVRLDGVPVYDPVSLGRSRSAFSPLALERITVRKAGFGVEHGSFAGGVIDIDQAVSDRMGPGGVSALVDPYSANAELSAPVRAFGGEGSLMVAGRWSVWDVYRESALDDALREWNQVDPVLMRSLVGDGARFTDALDFDAHRHGSDVGFSDVHAAFRLRFPGFRTLQGSFYRGSNRVATELFASGGNDATGSLERLFLTRDRYAWSNTAGQLRGDWLLGDRASLRVRAWGSRHDLEHAYGMVDGQEVGYEPEGADVAATEAALRDLLDGRGPTDDGNEVASWGAEARGDVAAGAGHFLSAGVEAVRVRSRTHLQNGFVLPLRADVGVWRMAGFVQDRWTPTPGLTVEAGTRLTSVAGGRVWAEPRVAVRVDGHAAGAMGAWSARLAWGIHRQFLNQFELTNVGPSALVPEVRFWLPADGTLDPPRARHLSAEVVSSPAPAWEIRAAAYHKELDRILSLDYGALLAAHGGTPVESTQADFVGQATGRAYGAGASLGWERGRARVRGGYEWNVSERTFPSRFDGALQPAPWSEPHTLSFQGRLPVGAGLAVESDARSVWGRTWGLRRAYYDFLTLHGTNGGPEIGLPEARALPTLHQVDLGVSWLGRMAGGLAEARLEVRNALGGEQVLDYSLRRTPAGDGSTRYETVPRHFPGRAFLLSLRVAF